MCYFGVIFVALAVWLDLRIPDRMADITMIVQTEGSEVSEVWQEGLWMLGTAFASMAAMIVVGYAARQNICWICKGLKRENL